MFYNLLILSSDLREENFHMLCWCLKNLKKRKTRYEVEIKHGAQEMIFIDKMKMVVPIANKKGVPNFSSPKTMDGRRF